MSDQNSLSADERKDFLHGYGLWSEVLNGLQALKEKLEQTLSSLDGNHYSPLMEKFGIEEVYRCEGCDVEVLSGDRGDRGFRCEDGEVFCAACAPTWDDAKKNIEAGNDAEAKADFAKSYREHLAAGGSASDKITYPL